MARTFLDTLRECVRRHELMDARRHGAGGCFGRGRLGRATRRIAGDPRGARHHGRSRPPRSRRPRRRKRGATAPSSRISPARSRPAVRERSGDRAARGTSKRRRAAFATRSSSVPPTIWARPGSPPRHTRDDQAETVLLRVCAGQGGAGSAASGRAAAASFGPLLDCDRIQVRIFLVERGLTWRRDYSNFDVGLDRARVRHGFLPALGHELNPRLGRTLAELADHARGRRAPRSAGRDRGAWSRARDAGARRHRAATRSTRRSHLVATPRQRTTPRTSTTSRPIRRLAARAQRRRRGRRTGRRDRTRAR